MRVLMIGLVALAGWALAPTAAGAQEEGASGRPDPGFDELSPEAQMEATLAANPGSTKLSDNEILLEPGVVLTLPSASDGGATTMGTPNCPYEWFCLYEHSNWDGWSIRFYTCNVLYGLSDYEFYNEREQRWDDWAYDASSWHNNQSGGAEAWIYKWSSTPAGGELYIADVGYVSYVGDHWNDSYWELYAC